MEAVQSLKELQDTIDRNSLLLVYMSAEHCGVCSVISPRLESLVEKYSSLKAIKVQADILPAVSAALGVFTIPCILVYIEGKEAVRQARYIHLEELEQQLDRYHQLLNS